MALRFKQGELAILTVGRGPISRSALGGLFTVHAVGPFRKYDTFPAIKPGYVLAYADSDGDYAITDHVGHNVMAMDWQLRKLDPPTEPERLRHVEDAEVTA